MIKVGFYQFKPLFGKPDQNCQKILTALARVDVDLIVLPELALSGYYFNDKAEALAYAEDPQKSPRLEAIKTLAQKRNTYLVVGFAEKCEGRCYNSAALIGPNGIEHIYRKVHLFNTEKFCFDPGDTPFLINNINDVKIGIMICFDWVFPEVMRTLALQGAEIICHPSNIVLPYFCQQTMLARCIENRVFAITANRYGQEKRSSKDCLRFTGNSQIVAPGGKLLHRATAQREVLYITEIDPSIANNKMITEHNHLFDDLRPEFYQYLESS